MKDATQKPGRRALIVTAKTLVADDLKDILLGKVFMAVDAVMDPIDMPDARYDVAFLDIPVARVLGDARLRAMQDGGTSIIILNGLSKDTIQRNAGILVLSQPFRTDDVHEILMRAEAAGGDR